jgi:hypothetical protein
MSPGEVEMIDTTDESIYRERCAFQEELDQYFPTGGMCAVLREVEGRLQPAGVVVSTGRLFCSDARWDDEAGEWRHEVLIDSRLSDIPIAEPVRVWVNSVRPHDSVKGLWEARVASDAGENLLLRVNTALRGTMRPTRRMRSAVTKAYESTLFPSGLVTT